MSTVPANTDLILDRVEERVYGVYRKESLLNFLNGILTAFSVFISLAVLLSVLESAFHFSSAVRTIIFASYSVSLIFTLGYIAAGFFYRTSRKRFNPVYYSSRIGSYFPAVRDRLSNAISLYRKRNDDAYTSKELVSANLSKTAEDTERINLEEFISYAGTRKRIYSLLSVITIASVLFVLTPLSDSLGRLINFRKNFGGTTNTAGTESGEADAFIKSFSVTIEYPAYTKLQPKTMEENTGDVVCIEGSVLKFGITTAEEMSEAGIDYNGVYSAFRINGNSAEGSVIAGKEGYYKFILKNREGRGNSNRKTYSVKLMPDTPPEIKIVFPGESEYSIFGSGEVDLKTIITDDFGFSKLMLYHKKSGAISSASNGFSGTVIPINNPDATSLEITYPWLIQGLQQGARYEYYLEVTDNSGKTARTETRFIVYNTTASYLKRTETTTKDIKSDLKTLLENVEKLQQEINDIKSNPEENAVNEQRKKDLQTKVENVQKNLDAVQNKIDRTLKELSQNPVLSEKTLEQFMKLQELFNKINTPEFREMLRKLQEAMKKNTEQFKRDLNDMKFDEEAFRKQLEQVMELMKKIENLQKMGDLTQKLDDMTKMQDELRKETEQTQKNNDSKMNTLADKQKDIKEDYNKFKQDMKDLIDNMKNTKNEMDTKSLENLLKKMNERQTENKMQKSSSELFKGQKEQSENTQKDISEDMNEFNQEMQDNLEGAMNNMDLNNKMMDRMKSIKKNLERLSEQEQDLKDETGKLDKEDREDFSDLSGEQNKIKKDLTSNIEDLMNMTKEGMQLSPELGKELGGAHNSMNKSEGNLKNGEKNPAMSNQGKAIESLNNAAKMLGDMLDQMGKQQGKGKKGEGRMGQLMQRLGQLIMMQQGVNGKMSNMGQNGRTGRDGKGGQEELSQEQKETLDKLRLEQYQIQKSLEELNAEFEKEKNRSGEKMLGDLKEVEKEMLESIRQMSEYSVDEKLLERQNKILSRMLDAQLSQREKDYEQKRESKPGDNVTRKSPSEFVISGPRTENALKDDLLRMEKQGYTEDYEKLIIEYNKLIKK